MNTKRNMATFLLLIVIFIVMPIFTNPTRAFVQRYTISDYNPPGFLSGIWNGLLAPYSLIARWFIDDIEMYAIPNTGWFYDFGFLIGAVGSLPIGWAAAILSTISYIFFFR